MDGYTDLSANVSFQTMHPAVFPALHRSIVVDFGDPGRVHACVNDDHLNAICTAYLSRSDCLGPIMYTVAPFEMSVVAIMSPIPCE